MPYTLYKDLTNVNFSSGNSGRKYIVIHYTGNKTDTAKANANYFRTVNRNSSAHYFVDNTAAYQVVADNNTAWAVGRNYGKNNLFGTVTNRNSISIEMCSADSKISADTYNNTVELTKSLMKKYHIPAANVVRHYDVCSKNCPGWSGWLPSNPFIWTQFKKDIAVSADTSTVSAASLSRLAIDDLWGTETTRTLQKIFGTTMDGMISNQWLMYKSANPGLTTGWDWKVKPNGKGSALIKALQKHVGMSTKEQDGQIGPKTIKAMQKYWNTTEDGKISKSSQLVKEIQRWANDRLKA